jgi:CRP-like cAMP-binding protein
MLKVTTSPIAQRLTASGPLSIAELGLLADIHRRRRSFRSGSALPQHGSSMPSIYILATGWAFTYKLLSDGTRQIIDFRIPGDVIGWDSLVSPRSELMVELITTAEATEVLEHDVMSTLLASPGLARGFLWAAARDGCVAAERLVGIGRRQSCERIAHFLLEIAARLNAVGIGWKDAVPCPLTQYQLADALGMTPVHVNRSLRTLREDGLLIFQKGEVTFLDYDGLVAFAGFDSSYLDYPPVGAQNRAVGAAKSFESTTLPCPADIGRGIPRNHRSPDQHPSEVRKNVLAMTTAR